mgnify:CR=1 FL=1
MGGFFCSYISAMTIQFEYEKKQVIQALRYHFLNRPEIRILLIFVNIFAIASAVLLYFDKVQPISFLLFSILWFLLMLVIWRILPRMIYNRSHTFKDSFIMQFEDEQTTLQTERGSKSWPWKAFNKFVESPYFFHLYFDARSFFLVPKDAFKDIREIQHVRSMLKQKISA